MRSPYRFLVGTLRGRLILGVAAVHAVMMALFIGDLTARQRAMLLDRQVEEAAALCQSLATSGAGWIAADDVAGLQELAEAQRRYPEILFALLADEQGRVLACTDRSKQGLYLLDLPREARETMFSETPSLVDIAAPAVVGGRHVGWARVGIGQKVAGEELAKITRSGGIYALAAIFVGSAVAWFMGRRITRRLYAVQETIDAVRSGDRLARSPIVGTDEPAVMAREFNAMLDALAGREVQLRASEERGRSLLRKVQAAIVLHDGEGRILDSNPLAQELLGLSADQVGGRALTNPQWHLLREDGSVLPADEGPVHRVLSTRQPLRAQVTGIRRPDRDRVAWVLVNAEPELDDAGEIRLVIVSFVDITERKRAEMALRRLNRELRAISDCNQVLVRASDEQTLLHDICRIVCDEAGYRMAWVGYAEDDEAKTIRPVAWAGAEDGYLQQARLTWAETQWGHGPSGTAIRSGETASIEDFVADSLAAPWRDGALLRGYRSSIALPLKDETARTFGVFGIYSAEPRAFDPDEERLLEELAGDLAFGIAVLRDRAERERAQEALRRSSEEIQDLYDHAPCGYHSLDADGTYVRINDTELQWLGYARDEIVGKRRFSDLVTGRGLETFRDHFSQFKQRGSVKDLEFEMVRHDGTILPVLVSATAVYDGDGHYLMSRSTVYDLTDRRKAQATEHLLGAIVQSSSDAIIAKDLDGIVLSWNRGAEQIYGYGAEEMLGKSIAMLVPPDCANEVPEILTRIRRAEQVERYTTERLRKDGRRISVALTVSPIRDPAGTIVGASSIARDVTERTRAEAEVRRLNRELEERVADRTLALETKKTELEEIQRALINIVEDLNEKTAELEQANAKLQELDRLKSTFIASMSHELRTPLNSIIGFSSILHSEWIGPANAEQKQHLAIILRSGKHLLSLINDVIDVSKIEAGKIESFPEEFDLHDLVDEAVGLVKNQLGDKGLGLRVEAPHERLRTDRRRLLQCVLNLLSNAVKFTDQGSVSVEARILPASGETREGGVAEIAVTDTGIGIERKDLPRMFQPFVRLLSPLQSNVPGTGLGLYLTRKLAVEILGGDVLVSSEVGTGSRFALRIPVRLT